ncbi:hypothetical protein EDB84DRAFT_1649116, partial [Lactarius hengduanensis]
MKLVASLTALVPSVVEGGNVEARRRQQHLATGRGRKPSTQSCVLGGAAFIASKDAGHAQTPATPSHGGRAVGWEGYELGRGSTGYGDYSVWFVGAEERGWMVVRGPVGAGPGRYLPPRFPRLGRVEVADPSGSIGHLRAGHWGATRPPTWHMTLDPSVGGDASPRDKGKPGDRRGGR